MPQEKTTATPTITRAIEVKLSINELLDKLDQAASYTYSFPGAPAYVARKMSYFNMKIWDLQRQARALRNKVPIKFRNER